MPRTLTGSFTTSGYKYNITDDTTEYQSNGYVGISTSGGDTIQYGVFLSPSGEEIFSNQNIGNISRLTLRLSIRKRTTNQAAAQIGVKWYRTAQNWNSASEMQYIITNASYYDFLLLTPTNTTTVHTMEATFTGSDVTYILRYGMGIYGMDDQFEVTSATLEADVTDGYVAPVITLTNGYGNISGGVYYHDPSKEMTLVVDYYQEDNEPIRQLTAEITTATVSARSFNGKTGETKVTIPDWVWTNLPQQGTIRLYCVSETGVSSETIEYPFVVSQYDVSFTSHTSGTIIQSDKNLIISWEARRKQGQPYIDPPTAYFRFIWYDDGSPLSGTLTTEKTYTIPSDELSGKKSVHIAICDVYGDMLSSSDTDNAESLNLYIQQVAGIEKVTVSPLQQSNPDIYFPRISVSWTSTGQSAYQVQVGDIYDSGVIWGKNTTHNVQTILDNGTYDVRLRVQDSSGMWGEWTEPVWITVENEQTTYNTIDAIMSGNEVMVKVTLDNPQLYDTVLLYRNADNSNEMIENGRQKKWILIGQTNTEGGTVVSFTDRNAGKTVQYFARSIIKSSGSYRVTETVSVDATPKTDGLFMADGTWVQLRYSKTFPRHYQSAVSEETYAKYYAGRQYPVYMRSGRRVREITCAYADISCTLADRIEAAAGQKVIYKNRVGQVVHGELNSVNAWRGRKTCEVSFVINQTDHSDEIPYTW